MKTEKRIELKGILKGVLITLLLLGIFVGGVAYATVVITDENIWVDGSAVIVEGDYSTWTHVWTNDVPYGLTYLFELGIHIDDVNDIIYLIYGDASSGKNIGIYKISDFSNIWESGEGVGYLSSIPDYDFEYNIQRGYACPYQGGASISMQTYFLTLFSDGDTLQLWRAGSTVWNHNTSDDTPATNVFGALISPTGKYIIVLTNNKKLLLYEGS